MLKLTNPIFATTVYPFLIVKCTAVLFTTNLIT